LGARFSRAHAPRRDSRLDAAAKTRLVPPVVISSFSASIKALAHVVSVVVAVSVSVTGTPRGR